MGGRLYQEPQQILFLSSYSKYGGMVMDLIVKGDLVFSRNRHELEAVENGLLRIHEGKIAGILSSLEEAEGPYELLDCTGRLVIPGLYDLHSHASQNHFKGLFMDLELLSWLRKHTFVEEARFSDREFYTEAYDEFARELEKSATVGAVTFATIHREATLYLMEALERTGILSYVGKVNMDRNAPDSYRESTEESISETLMWLEECRKRGFLLSRPIITPRFIPSVTDELARWLGRIAREGNYPVQSHLSENLDEVELVEKLCPESSSYADAYRRRGLWGVTRTVMAHCVWSRLREDGLLKDRNVFIAHCPDSNTNLYSGIAPAKYFLDNGFNIGLGSDVAGGSSLSIFRCITDAIKASKLRYRLVEKTDGLLTFAEAFYMATEGGGAFFGRCGSFKEGYDSNVVVLDEERTLITSRLSLPERLERYAYITPERSVLHKIVNGKLLY